VDFASFGDVAEHADGKVTIHVPRDVAAERTASLVRALGDRIEDISVEDPPIEDVIDKVFTAGTEIAS
jgi:ABC-type uncharacterized transport system ATPase subunit